MDKHQQQRAADVRGDRPAGCGVDPLGSDARAEPADCASGNVKASKSDGSWTLKSQVRLSNGNYAVTATQSGDAPADRRPLLARAGLVGEPVERAGDRRQETGKVTHDSVPGRSDCDGPFCLGSFPRAAAPSPLTPLPAGARGTGKTPAARPLGDRRGEGDRKHPSPRPPGESVPEGRRSASGGAGEGASSSLRRRQPDRRLLIDMRIRSGNHRRLHTWYQVNIKDLLDARVKFEEPDQSSRGEVHDRNTALQPRAVGRDRHAAEGRTLTDLGETDEGE